jgi:hypothetical protein
MPKLTRAQVEESLSTKYHSRNKNAEQTDVRDAVLEAIELAANKHQFAQVPFATTTAVAVPQGSYENGDQITYRYVATSATEGDRVLTLPVAILAATGDSWPKTLVQNKVYHVTVMRTASNWVVRPIEGPY